MYDLIDSTYEIAEIDGEDDSDSAHKRKPWGETFHFCPVALHDNGVLWPGSQDTALRLVQTIISMLGCLIIAVLPYILYQVLRSPLLLQ